MRKIDFFKPDIGEEEILAVSEVLRSGWITTGKKTKEFEQKISEYCKTDTTICLNSATACMTNTLRLLGIGQGDEVITSAFTYTATVSAIIHAGATPILVDTQKNSYNMDLEMLNDKISDKTKAVICVDIAGMMSNYDEIFEVLNRNKAIFNAGNKIQSQIGRVALISDSAHSFGSMYKGKISGQIADFTCFSFHAVKNLTTGEGGALTFKSFGTFLDSEIYKQMMLLSLHGQTKDAMSKSISSSWEYDVVAPYYKCNMTDISASIGIEQLKKYDQTLKKRAFIADKYTELLDEKYVEITTFSDKTTNYNGHLYQIRLINKDLEYRNKFIDYMLSVGVSLNVHFKPIPLLSAYKNLGFNIKDYPNSYDFYQNVVSLPIFNQLKLVDIEYICEKINIYLRGN